MKNLILFALSLFTAVSVSAQEVESLSSSNGILKPALSNSGIVFTDSRNEVLFIERDGKTSALTSSPGSGRYYSVSPDGKSIGFKYINSDGSQIPALVDPSTKKITFLWDASKEAGQVSFADNGTFAFTISTKLIVKNNDETKQFELGNYSNIAPISPDAKYAAYNDNSDQLYIINLKSGVKQKLTDDKRGYFMPQWSPDATKLLYSSLNAKLFVYDLTNGKTYDLGEGHSSSWSGDSHMIVFYRQEVEKLVLKNSDIYLCDYEGKNLLRLTNTPGVFECDPAFTSDGGIIYSYIGSTKITESKLSSTNFKLTNSVDRNISLPQVKTISLNSAASVNDVDTLDIPYINQLDDTPDYFWGGWACGPTSAMMVLAYYKILPTWTVRCSGPYSHYSPYGRYISDTYRFKQTTYSNSAENDSHGHLGQGAFGFMWSGGNSPHSTMVAYFKNHGINAAMKDNPTYSDALSQINSGKPYIVCVALTDAGHIVVAHGTAAQSHTLIFNDPYGDKNLPPYGNYYGENVKYDWPGYNNSYQNLKTVYWSVSVNYQKPATTDTLIDDLDFYNGFFMRNQAPSSMASWKDLNQGYRDHMWFAYTHSNSEADTNYATWTPKISKTGYYNIEAYVPMSQAVDAQYHIFAVDGEHLFSMDQAKYTDSWVSLGNYKFDTSETCHVRLGDASSVGGQAVIFDAMRWTYVDSAEVTAVENHSVIPSEFSLDQNYPNPFNPSTIISYQLPQASKVSLKIYDVLGNEVAVLVNKFQTAGAHSVSFDAGSNSRGKQLSSGLYLYKLQAGSYSAVRKMLLLK